MSNREHYEEQIKKFGKHRTDVLGSGSDQHKRDLIFAAINKKGGSTESYAYQFLPGAFPVEVDILACLSAFRVGDGYPKEFVIADLKLLRRYALRRYAFGLAGQINEHLAGLGESKVWLWKDFGLLRLAGAIPLGYMALLGEPYKWIWELRKYSALGLCLTLLLLGLALVLIHLNVRDEIGRQTGATMRTGIAFGIGVAWCGLFVGIAYGFVVAYPTELKWMHDWIATLVLTAGAYCLAVLVQFFFPGEGSIADPL